MQSQRPVAEAAQKQIVEPDPNVADGPSYKTVLRRRQRERHLKKLHERAECGIQLAKNLAQQSLPADSKVK